MGALEILEQWVKPITEPLNDFLSETRALATTHQNSVTTFNNLVQDLTEGNASDAFAGDGASSFVELTGEYLTSEVALSGTTGALAGPLLEAAGACSTMVASVGEGVTAAVAAAPEVETLVEVTAVIDVTTAAQGGLDVPEDVVAVGATSVSVWVVIGILVTLGLAIAAAWFIWQNAMNSIASSPMPKLPKTPSPPKASLADDLSQQYGVPASVIQDIINANPGLTPEEYALLVQYYKKYHTYPFHVRAVFTGLDSSGNQRIYFITQGDIDHVKKSGRHPELDTLSEAQLIELVKKLLQTEPDDFTNYTRKGYVDYYYDNVEINGQYVTIIIRISTTNPWRIISVFEEFDN